MPSLPWKKAKAKAISKFVVDRIQSSKHGGSLVVETGFPTSVVDLFVKNRNRLKKPPSSSTKKISKSSSKSPSLDLIPLPPIPPSSPTPLLFSPDSRTPTNFLLPPPIPLPPHVQQDGDDVCQGDCDSTMLFMAMLKMFFVVLLAFATSKFVVGITLSAFLLLFMEYAGKHLCRLFFSSSKFKPKPKPKPSSSSDDDVSSLQCMCMINKALSSLSFHKFLQCFLGFLRIKRNLFSNQDAAARQEEEEEEEEEEDFKAPPTPPQQQQDTTKTATPHDGHFHEIEISAPTSTNLVPPRPRRRIP